MSKREQIAAMAMQGILGNSYWNENGHFDPESVARSSVDYADALIAHLKLPPTSEESSAVEADKNGWIPHNPGNPMPCEGGSRIRIRLRNGVMVTTIYPEDFEWGEIPYHTDEEIIAWKPAE